MGSQQLRIDAQRTVENIVATARDVLAENPHASIAEIADRAEVHRTTLTRYFPTREALVESILARALEAIDSRIAEAGTESSDVIAALRRATLGWLEEATRWRTNRYAPLGQVPGSSEAPARIRARMTALIERGQREGPLRNDVPAVSLYLAWAGMTIASNALATDLPPEQVADNIVTMLSAP